MQMTEWGNEGVPSQEPACGALFSPYGPAELTFAHALLAQTVIAIMTQRVSGPLHRIWIGAIDRIRDAGGRLTDNCCQEFGDLGAGNRILEAQWTPATDCPVCTEQSC